eukprot:TRINITY_DN5831_c0_g1_i2.p1 TRINITY_DN5831_c0_g1~~TRINITY_DN5831_c0_g1_i2.p1  ORF type:complete len:558 (+),score=129.87 TRINITY_DN5831_c0_g1_i2:104-1675(+)
MHALQEETSIMLNTVDSVDGFVSDVTHGNWDIVLRVVSSMHMPPKKLVSLYEHVFLEMLEMRELETARALLRQTEPLALLKQREPDRYQRLEHLLGRSSFDPKEAYTGGHTKEKRRATIAQALSKEVSVVPPSRLLFLLQQATRWQRHTGAMPFDGGVKVDLFRGTKAKDSSVQKEHGETYPKDLSKTIQFGKKSYCEVARFSPDGRFLVSGSVDGFVEVWDPVTAKLNKELPYQASEEFMMHDEAVLALAFSRDSEFLASGSQDGAIKVWQLLTGKCMRRMDQAHTKGVTSLCFSRDGTQLISSSYDMTAKVHGLKSGKTIKVFRGHQSFVNDVIFTPDGSRAITASSDGAIKVWDMKTSECMSSFSPTRPGQLNEVPVFSVAVLPRSPDQIIVCSRGTSLAVMTMSGHLVREFSIDPNHTQPSESSQKDPKAKEPAPSSGTLPDIIAFSLSPKGDYLYCITSPTSGDISSSSMHCFNVNTSALEHTIPKLHSSETLGLTHHPNRSMLATYSKDGTINVWVP